MPSLRRALTALALVPALAGCPSGGGAPAGFKVALLTEGSIADGGWNQGAFEGLKAIEAQLGASVSHVQVPRAQDFEDTFRDFAKRGHRLLFGHGFEFQDAARKVGAEFPGAVFVVMSGVEPFANGSPIVFKIEEAMYLAGVAAAKVTKTGKLGAVGGMSIPPVVRGFKAFAAGARRVSRDVSVNEPCYLGSWGDPAKGREQALALIAAGVDVIVQNADKSGLGVFGAAKERGILAIGANKDQGPVAPDVVLASAVIDIPGSMLDVAREVKAGTFKAGRRLLGLAEGRVALVLNEAVARARLDDAARKELEAAKQDLLSGKVKLEE